VQPGQLIAIEGIDGAGTTTQARSLVEWLNASGYAAHLTCEPSAGPMGVLLRDVLGQRTRPMDPAAVALLFAADRVDHIRVEIEPNLARGTHVVTDRYIYSSLAYQSINLDYEWVAEINRLAPEPDLTIYVRTDPDLACQRRQHRGSAEELYDGMDLQRRIAARYDTILGSSPTDGSWSLDPDGSSWIRQGSGHPGIRMPQCAIVDGALPIDVLQKQLRNLVQKVAPPTGT
jgi:dTMP kinase